MKCRFCNKEIPKKVQAQASKRTDLCTGCARNERTWLSEVKKKHATT